MENFYKRQAKKDAGPQRKNQSPEKDLVATPCLQWMRAQGWQVEVYESKATYNPFQKRWRSSSAKPGTPDCMGIMPDGTAIATEFKAPRKLYTLSEEQRVFLTERIKMNAFACVTDSVDRLKELFKKWNDLRYCTPLKAQEYLLDALPKPKKERPDPRDMDWYRNL